MARPAADDAPDADERQAFIADASAETIGLRQTTSTRAAARRTA